MAEQVVASADAEGIEQNQDDERKGRRSRFVIALLILLLLLLCVLTSVADVYLTHTPEQIAFVRRNIGCLECHTELIPDISKASVHNPFFRRDCRTCHTPHGYEVMKRVTLGRTFSWQRIKGVVEWLPVRMACSAYEDTSTTAATGGQTTAASTKGKGAPSYLTGPADQLCWTCHGDLGPLRSDTYQHQPFAEGRCTDCHDPHASDERVLLKMNARELCKTCHPMGAELNRSQTHPPAAQWFCTNCHNPHASNWRGILVRRQRELCFECHPSVAPLSQKSVQHNPFLYDNCSGCHEPHGADTRPLLVQSQPDLCYSCHPTIENDFEKKSHHPVGVKLVCADCHNPHAADYPALLTARNNSFCYQCHGSQIRARYEASKHDVNLCVRCHSPHGSDFAPLLRNGNPDLCEECHNVRDTGNNYEGTNRHPVRNRFYDVHHKTPLTCTSTCHDPHGTSRDMMLNYEPHDDAICLTCHKGVGVTY